jgi:transketolase
MSDKIKRIEDAAREIRRDVVEMVYQSKDGHPSPSFSAADIIAALYFEVMNIRPDEPSWADRDRFVLSKGHACPALYAALAQKGYYSKEELPTLRHLHTILQGHPYQPKTPGLDATTGSLGNGVSMGLGMALAGRIAKKDYRVYVITGDGELGEGLIWESAMAAGHLKTDKLSVFIDNNNFQSGGSIEEISGAYPIAEKWESFGWHVQTINGHDVSQILAAIEAAKKVTDKPSAIVAKTNKGHGLSYMIGDNTWHKRVYTDEEYGEAMIELGGRA